MMILSIPISDDKKCDGIGIVSILLTIHFALYNQIVVTWLLIVYIGTPSMFITLWFGFDYGTNPPLGTLII
jgi:hypothetical protein